MGREGPIGLLIYLGLARAWPRAGVASVNASAERGSRVEREWECSNFPQVGQNDPKGFLSQPPSSARRCGLVGVLSYPFRTPVPQEWCPEGPMSRGAPQFYPTLSIIHASRPVSTTWQASQQQEQGLFTVYFLVNIYLLAQGPLPGRPPYLGSMLKLLHGIWKASC